MNFKFFFGLLMVFDIIFIGKFVLLINRIVVVELNINMLRVLEIGMSLGSFWFIIFFLNFSFIVWCDIFFVVFFILIELGILVRFREFLIDLMIFFVVGFWVKRRIFVKFFFLDGSCLMNVRYFLFDKKVKVFLMFVC